MGPPRGRELPQGVCVPVRVAPLELAQVLVQAQSPVLLQVQEQEVPRRPPVQRRVLVLGRGQEWPPPQERGREQGWPP